MTDSLDPRPEQGTRASSLGLEPTIGGALCYLLGFVSAIAFLILERNDAEVRFHAFQSLATFGGLFVISVAAGVIPFVGWIVSLLVAPVSIILWLVLMVKALQGERLELPVVGDWAKAQAGL